MIASVKKLYFLFFVFVFSFSVSYASEIKDFSGFTKDDRVLILAAHPDDEVIGAAGVIQEALKKGSKIKVVFFTNGDQNEMSFIFTKKRFAFRKDQFLQLGEARIKESLGALQLLGLGKEDIIFLGYPDFWTLEILNYYWESKKPFRSIFTRISKVSYPEAFSVDAPYVGESILGDIESIILDFKPTKIFVSHPSDNNKDHKSLYLFLKVALWDLEDKFEKPQIFPFLVHFGGWPRPRGYYPDLSLDPPEKLNEVLWQKLLLTKEEVKAKYNTILFYKSQNAYNPSYLISFARKNELFGDYPPIKLKETVSGEIAWYYFREENQYNSGMALRKDISSLAYAIKGGNLYVKMVLKRKIDKDFGISIFLFGYNKNIAFAKMPKINILIDIFGLHIKNKKEKIFDKSCKLTTVGRESILEVPLSVLGNPDYILSSAKTKGSGLPKDETAWRVIELE